MITTDDVQRLLDAAWRAAWALRRSEIPWASRARLTDRPGIDGQMSLQPPITMELRASHMLDGEPRDIATTLIHEAVHLSLGIIGGGMTASGGKHGAEFRKRARAWGMNTWGDAQTNPAGHFTIPDAAWESAEYAAFRTAVENLPRGDEHAAVVMALLAEHDAEREAEAVAEQARREQEGRAEEARRERARPVDWCASVPKPVANFWTPRDWRVLSYAEGSCAWDDIEDEAGHALIPDLTKTRGLPAAHYYAARAFAEQRREHAEAQLAEALEVVAWFDAHPDPADCFRV